MHGTAITYHLEHTFTADEVRAICAEMGETESPQRALRAFMHEAVGAALRACGTQEAAPAKAAPKRKAKAKA